MTIKLKKFGTILTSRPAGREAFSAIRHELTSAKTPIMVDFSEVIAVTPSWVDEFLTPLAEYASGKVELIPTDNTSVIATLKILAEANQEPVASIARRYLRENL